MSYAAAAVAGMPLLFTGENLAQADIARAQEFACSSHVSKFMPNSPAAPK